MVEMRALIMELRPETLEREGLVSALEQQAAVLPARYGIEVDSELDAEPALPLPAKEALYRVAQEALNNVIKHVGSGRVMLRLQSSGEQVELAVTDEGPGFDPEQPFPGHLGLHSMRERVEEVGGTLAIESVPGRGTTVRAVVPL